MTMYEKVLKILTAVKNVKYKSHKLYETFKKFVAS